MTDHTPLDTDAVALWMADHIKGFQGPVSAIKFTLGQSNPTYALTAQSGPYLFRRQLLGILLKSAHSDERASRMQTPPSPLAVPVARKSQLLEAPTTPRPTYFLQALCALVTVN